MEQICRAGCLRYIESYKWRVLMGKSVSHYESVTCKDPFIARSDVLHELGTHSSRGSWKKKNRHDCSSRSRFRKHFSSSLPVNELVRQMLTPVQLHRNEALPRMFAGGTYHLIRYMDFINTQEKGLPN